MVAIKAAYSVNANQATVGAHNGGLKCASGIAKTSVFIGAANSSQGSPHLVLLGDQSGTWVIANSKPCNSSGQPTRPIPASLGMVCGVQ